MLSHQESPENYLTTKQIQRQAVLWGCTNRIPALSTEPKRIQLTTAGRQSNRPIPETCPGFLLMLWSVGSGELRSIRALILFNTCFLPSEIQLSHPIAHLSLSPKVTRYRSLEKFFSPCTFIMQMSYFSLILPCWCFLTYNFPLVKAFLRMRAHTHTHTHTHTHKTSNHTNIDTDPNTYAPQHSLYTMSVIRE